MALLSILGMNLLRANPCRLRFPRLSQKLSHFRITTEKIPAFSIPNCPIMSICNPPLTIGNLYGRREEQTSLT